MKSVGISEFKARCIQLLKNVQTSGEPLLVTLRDKPLARVEPVAPPSSEIIRLGTMAGTVCIKGDIVHWDSTEDWEMNN
jgi:prevent-host-death family protein